jgi:hypothetical protein
MKQRIFALIFLFTSYALLSTNCFGQLMQVDSKDSLNGKPRLSSRLIGRLKLNGLYDVAGTLAGNSAFLIHLNDVSGKDIPAFNMDMRQSQLRFRSTLQLKNGKELNSMLEADFEGPNNSSQFRLRHAWLSYGRWMAGQNWSTFGDGDLWPASLLDWDGPTGMVVSRRIQVRYSSYQTKTFPFVFQAAIEYMEPRRLFDFTLDPGHGVDYAPSRLPDFVLALRHNFDNGGFVKVAEVLRSIAYDSKNVAGGDTSFQFASETGWGTTVLTSIFFKEGGGLVNNLQAQWTIGKGLADYFLAIGGSGMDGFANSSSNGQLILLPTHAGFISYQKYWTKKFHSMVVGSYSYFFDAGRTTVGWDKMTNYYLTLNVSYDFFNFLMVAFEPQFGYKKLQYTSGNTQGANAVRLAFGFLFNF